MSNVKAQSSNNSKKHIQLFDIDIVAFGFHLTFGIWNLGFWGQ